MENGKTELLKKIAVVYEYTLRTFIHCARPPCLRSGSDQPCRHRNSPFEPSMLQERE